MPLDRARIARDFARLVNMGPAELTAWLETAESRAVGFKASASAESVGHASGRRIVAILGTPPADRDNDDLAHMRKVIGYIRRHRAQEPANTVTSRWRYALMNWGHDPLKDLE